MVRHVMSAALLFILLTTCGIAYLKMGVFLFNTADSTILRGVKVHIYLLCEKLE